MDIILDMWNLILYIQQFAIYNVSNFLFAKKFDQWIWSWYSILDKLKFIAIHYNRIKYLLPNTTLINKTNNE